MVADPSELRELENFGPAARRAVALAEIETRDLGHDWIGTEHLLLGLLARRECRAAKVLNQAGVTLAAARHQVGEAVGDRPGGPVLVDVTPRTARASRALERAVRFSRQSRSDAVASTHLLLGVIDVEGRAGQVLRRLGVDIKGLLAALDGSDADEPAPVDASGPADEDRVVAPAACSCGALIDDELVFRIVSARSERQEMRDVVVYSCGRCGGVVGVTIE